MMNKIIKISLKLDKMGFQWTEVEWNAKETSKVYVLTRKDKDGDETTRHLRKEEVGLILKRVTTPYHIEFYVRCTEDKVEMYKLKLMERVKSVTKEFRTEIELLNNHFLF